MTKQQYREIAKKLGVKVPKSWTKFQTQVKAGAAIQLQINEVKHAIEHHEKFSTVYFWTPPSSASGRRSMEHKNQYYHELTLDGVKYSYSSNVSCSCKNVYYDGTFEINEKRKDVRAYKKLLNTLETMKAEVWQ